MAVYPRQIFKRCLELDASVVVVFHNHPSGCGHPSKTDIDNANNLKKILYVLDIDLVDDIVVGKPGSSESLKKEGYLKEIEEE